MWLIRYSISNPLVTNLSLGIIIIMGVLAWRSMPQEMFPNIELDAVSINVEFEGASPEEVERQVSIPIEEEFEGMPDIDVLTSTSSEGMASIMITLKSGTNVDEYMRDAQTALDQITDLPDEAEEPELVRVKVMYRAVTCTSRPTSSSSAWRRFRVWPASVWPVTASGRSGSRSTRSTWQRTRCRSTRSWTPCAATCVICRAAH